MKKSLLSFYVFLGCFALRLLSDYQSVFTDASDIDDGYYHPSLFVKRLSEACVVIVDMVFMIPIALLIYHLISEKNEYRTIITLLSSWAIYDILFHVIKHTFS